MSKSINVEELKAQMSSLVNSNEAIENVLGKVQTETKIEETILEMQKEAAEWVKTCSANNVIKVGGSNQEFVNKIEKLVTQLSKEGINKYFMSGNVSTEHLLNSLYSLQALASYYMYNQHNGEKAREILLKSKKLAEQYVLNRSSVSFDFDELTKEETHTELNIITDLPEMYAGIVYLLGRTYMYQGDKAEGIPYFELSKYLGNELKLFEGYLSERSGLGVIKREEIEKDIANKDYEQATNKLNESVQLYQKLKSDNTIYKEGYKPGTGEYKKYNQVRPTQDVYNQVECSEQLTNYYMQLLTLTNDKVKYSEYVREISNQFIGSDALPGMLKQSKDVPLKKETSILNSLGKILLKLHDKKIDFKELKDAVSKELQLTREANLTERDDLNIVKQIFTLAKAKGKQGDFTEADAYDGLRMVCDRQLKQGVEEGQRKELLSYISAHKKARDEINKALNRTIKYESDDESDVESTTTAATVPLTSSTSLLVNLAEDTAVQLNLMGADSVSHSDIGC